jgi:hypothetical protein
MNKLAEIEQATQVLPLEDKQRLILWLANILRAKSDQLPPPRVFSKPEVLQWIAEDEIDLKIFLNGA